MHDGLKIMIGAGATALMAWAVHGPLGQGKAFVVGLERDAEARLAARGLPNVKVDFPAGPYSRMAHLSGAATLVEQDDALKLVRSLGGTSGAVWGDSGPIDGASALVASGPANAAHKTQSIEDWRREQLGAVLNSMAAPLPGEKRRAPPAKASPTPAPSATPVPKVTPAATATPKAPPVIPLKPTPSPKPTPTPTAAPRPTPVALVRPAVPGRPSANPCQRGIDAALAGRVMSFRSGSAWLSPQSSQMIDDVAAVLKRCRSYAIEIGGHTDGNGDEGVNRAMSQERANRVRAALIAKGVPAGAILAKGYGSARPIRAGNTLDPANRRISFTISRGGL